MTEIGMLKLGDRFSSFADAKKAIEELGENTYTTFWKRDARTIASSKIVRPIESSLIYYQLLYACNHGGKKFKSSGKKIRQSWTFKKDCPVHVRFKASSDGKALEVTSVQMKHNHVTSKVLHARNPSQRKLSSNMKESVKDSLNMKANRKTIVDSKTVTSFLEKIEPTELDSPSTANNVQSISLTTNQLQPPSTYTQTRKKCLLLCIELADLAAQRTGILFDQRLNVLKNLKTLWANDTEVAIVPVDENQTQFFIGSDDAVVFESKNQSSVEHSEVCDETDLQDRNNMSEALILDNRNTSTLGQSPVEAPEFCNELVIKEEMTSDEAHQLSYISDSVLNDVNNQSHQIVEVNDFALTTIKMPVSIKKRGRPKGQDLTVIGLPKKKKRCTVAFVKQSYHEKQNVILNCFVKDRNIVRDITNGKFLETVDLKMLPEEISHAVLDEAVDIHMIRSFCTEKAFEKIANLVEQKRLQQSWFCSVCSEDTQKNHMSLCCSRCLLWRHIRCAGLTKRPKSKLWFCRECYL